MKIVSFRHGEKESFGVVINDGIVDLKKKLNNEYSDLKTFLEKGNLEDINIDVNDVQYPLDDVSLLPVIPNPEKIVCVGLNYHAHVEECGETETATPVIFFRYPSSQIGHEENLILPKESSQLDFEGEIAVVIGKSGRRISVEDAYNHIAGYSCYNDGSVRDWQLRTSQWGPGKNFDGTGGFGPWLVTRDEIKDGEVLSLETRVNGEVMQSSTTNLLIFSIPKLISFISNFTTLKPGDVIVTGTPGGVGLKREPQFFLKNGDVVEIEVSKVGTLRNTVKAE
ncbi:2-keto-4-pentenoate hydratase/2-oxohepta-3-ene-1,7-dioic acid hydratase in catechol pathway [Evansella vedderi]|uniref:2-keto-4-pentenoate hydratase/2-oxohepta-3-ene-1,7-dioic acid hydratase in catechol pathway n=1 Tax=Evansella vedderi TaxID=38282 RepID=A0ABU0A2H5_9BACI|nr:fumarylacetoacetate hydrolase family protein [Evansella vedderi]MDQ0257156.1 2-keto-4-pentenoate hydratase/2-oxohepta-3-ene-1,7-dioic acid hydratase in catechol pathway [Evansella vedderi]